MSSFRSFVLLLSATAAFAANGDLTERYRAAAKTLTDAAMADVEGYERLAYLCDRIGNRLSGSPSLERAVAWSAEQMKGAGLTNVQVVPTMAPHWVRGAEFARVVSPVDQPLRMLGLGMSVATPPEGITAEVVAVSDFDELEKLGQDKVRGKIVVFNQIFQGYDATAAYRLRGPSRAAALGAVAALIRSVTPLPMRIPHTGTLVYDPAAPKIPAASLAPEDAMMVARMAADGPVRVHLQMSAQTLPDVETGTVVGEIRGRELPEEVVVIGGHIDSWDVGQGAQDDGAALMASLQAVSLMKKLGLQPRRTLRVVFWANEENGSRGGAAYRAWVGDRIGQHVAAIEMDGGAEAPIGFGAGVDSKSLELLRQIGKLLEPIGAGQIAAGGGGTDIAPLMRDGVPGLAQRTTGVNYFNWHHTEADTLDKVDPVDFRKNIAAMAVMSYVLADMPGRLTAAPR